MARAQQTERLHRIGVWFANPEDDPEIRQQVARLQDELILAFNVAGFAQPFEIRLQLASPQTFRRTSVHKGNQRHRGLLRASGERPGNKRFLDRVIRYFGTTSLAKIDQDAIDAGARKIYPNTSGATRNRQFYTPVSAVIKHAAKRGWCSHIVMERPEKPPGRLRWLTPEQAEHLIAACGGHLPPLVIFLLYTGARIGEALWLDWLDVDLSRGHVTFPVDPNEGRRTKNNEPRGVPLHPRVRAALANLSHRRGEVFRRPDGMPNARLRENDTSAGDRIKKAFAGACDRAGIKDFTPHDCRHTWATWHYANNRDLLALQRLGGWKTLSMVTRYAHVNVGKLAHTIDNLPWPEAGGNLGDTAPTEAKSA